MQSESISQDAHQGGIATLPTNPTVCGAGPFRMLLHHPDGIQPFDTRPDPPHGLIPHAVQHFGTGRLHINN